MLQRRCRDRILLWQALKKFVPKENQDFLGRSVAVAKKLVSEFDV